MSALHPKSISGILGNGRLGALKPPTVLNPHRWISARLFLIHDSGAAGKGSQVWRVRGKCVGGFNWAGSSPLMPTEKKRSPHGVTSHEAPPSVSNLH